MSTVGEEAFNLLDVEFSSALRCRSASRSRAPTVLVSRSNCARRGRGRSTTRVRSENAIAPMLCTPERLRRASVGLLH